MKKTIAVLLSFTMLFSAISLFSLPAAAANEDIIWGFDTAGDFEGWTQTMRMENLIVEDGSYSMSAMGRITTPTTQNPAFYSPDGYTCSADVYTILKLRIKNGTAATAIGAYFTTTAATSWSESKKVSISIAANSSEYVEYTIDLAQNGNWNGTFKRFMFGLGDVTGNISIDYVKLCAAGNAPLIYMFNDGTTGGWTSFGNHTTENSSNALRVTRTAAAGDGAAYSPALNLDTATYKYLVFSAKSNIDTTAKFYYRCDENAYSEANTETVTITAGTSYGEYYIDFSDVAAYSGSLKAFMLQISDVGVVDFDWVKLLTSYTPPAPPPTSAVKMEWNFDDNTTQGWSPWGTHSATAANGALALTRSTSGNGAIYSPSSISLDTSVYKYFVFRVKSPSDTILKFYFKCDANGYNETNTKVISIAASTDYIEYAIDFSAHPNWTGSFKQFMMMLQSDITAQFDSILLTNTYDSSSQTGVRVILNATSDTITTADGTTTITASVTSSNTLSDYGVIWKTDSINAVMTKNANGSVTLTGKLNGQVTVKAISKADSKAYATKTITISGQHNTVAEYDLKVMLCGNSILSHGPSASLGWSGNWGMAASAQEKDYVHRLMNYYAGTKYGDIDYSLFSIATFEKAIVAADPYDYSSSLSAIKTAVETYEPDLVNLQMGENVSVTGLTAAQYANALGQLIETIQTASPGVKIMLCTSFWGGTVKVQGIQLAAAEYNLPIADLSTLNTNENKAIGLFDNTGVAAHPGDVGMDNIAKLIWANMDDIIADNFAPTYESLFLPESISIQSASNAIATEGGSLQLTAVVSPAEASGVVNWSVSDPTKAQIDATGLLTAKNNGLVTITATSKVNSVSATKQITISGQSIPYTLTYAAGTTDTVTNLPTADPYAKGIYTLSAQKPLRAAYQFVGWSLTQNGGVLNTVSITGNTTVYAVWRKAVVWEFETEGDYEGVAVQNGFNLSVLGDKLTAIATGTDAASGNVLRIVSPTLALSSASYRVLSISMQNTAFNANTKVKLAVTTTNGTVNFEKAVDSIGVKQYYFDLSSCSGTITGFMLEPTNIDCTVNVESIRFLSGKKLTYDKNTAGTVTGMPETEYAQNLATYFTVSEAVPVRDNYEFAGWSLTPDGVAITETQLSASESVTLYALWNYTESRYLVYTITDGKVTITDCDTAASGAMIIPATIEGYPVTAIGNNALQACTNITSVVIPSGVTTVGTYAFQGCTKLVSAVIPDSVTSLGAYSFFSCTALETVTVGSSVTSMGNKTFASCTKLKRLLFRGNVPTTLGSNLFQYVPTANVTVYYFTGKTGWTNLWSGFTTVPFVSVTFDANAGGDAVTGLPSVDTMGLSGMSYTLPTRTPSRSGYLFRGWSFTANGAVISGNIFDLSGATTLYALWQENVVTYTLRFHAGTTDMVTDLPDDMAVNENQEINLAEHTPTRDGYRFLGWSTEQEGTSLITSIVLSDADGDLYAVWEEQTTETVTQEPTSTRPGRKQIKDHAGNVIRTEEIAMLSHFGTQRGKQVSSGTTIESETTTVRLIMGINSLEYAKAGFIIAARDDLNKESFDSGDNHTVMIDASTVYSTISAGSATFTAADFGAKYLVAIEIEDFPKAAYGNQMRVQGFVIAQDGTTIHYDTAVVITVEDLIGEGI